jgi:hypothetical protein
LAVLGQNLARGSVPAGLALASDFSFCFQCKVDSSLVLRLPIETTLFSSHLSRTDRARGLGEESIISEYLHHPPKSVIPTGAARFFLSRSLLRTSRAAKWRNLSSIDRGAKLNRSSSLYEESLQGITARNHQKEN